MALEVYAGNIVQKGFPKTSRSITSNLFNSADEPHVLVFEWCESTFEERSRPEHVVVSEGNDICSDLSRTFEKLRSFARLCAYNNAYFSLAVSGADIRASCLCLNEPVQTHSRHDHLVWMV